MRSWRHSPAGNNARQFRAAHREWAQGIASRLPDSFRAAVVGGWDARYGIPINERNGSPVARANAYACEAVKDFGNARAALAYDETAIKTYAENYAGTCARLSSRERRAQFVRWFGIDPPEGKRVTDVSACLRMDDPYWWRRQLRKVWTRSAENAMRRAGVIRKGRAPYASDEAVRHRRARQWRTADWLKSRVMVNGEGEQLDLIALHEKSLANPALRRGEFMTRMRGFEEIATDLGHVALFFTLTAPSAFHAQLSTGGINPKYQRQTVRDAQAWLCKMWARARAKLARLSISFYGFRVAEPHHDATPHWHMVLFVPPNGERTLRDVLRLTWLSDFADEPGANDHRCKCVTIDAGKGSATGYVAKYVSKNIDGAGAIGDEISDETGGRVLDSVARVAAWASCHGVRQFQQIGGPPVGLWRECRRVREAVDAGAIEQARTAADAGNWRAFIDALGGIEKAKKRVRCISEKYSRSCEVTPETAHEFPRAWIERAEPRSIDSAGREVLAVTRYGETPATRAVGVVAFGLLGRWASMRTRKHRWRIEKKCGHSLSVGTSAARSESGTRLSSAQSEGFISISGARSAFLSDLGPVAITVRGSILTGGFASVRNPTDGIASRPESRPPFKVDPALAWIATVPYRQPKRAPS